MSENMITLTHKCGHTQEWTAEALQGEGEAEWQASHPCKPCIREKHPMKPGWSNAAKARTARSHPLGVAIEADEDCTVYQDTVFGGGRVRIYDGS